MVAKIKFVPESKTVLGMRNLLNSTHETMCLYQDYLVEEFLRFMKKEGEVLTFRRLLVEAKEYFGQYSPEILELNPNNYSEEKGKELIRHLLGKMKSSNKKQNMTQQELTL